MDTVALMEKVSQLMLSKGPKVVPAFCSALDIRCTGQGRLKLPCTTNHYSNMSRFSDLKVSSEKGELI